MSVRENNIFDIKFYFVNVTVDRENVQTFSKLFFFVLVRFCCFISAHYFREPNLVYTFSQASCEWENRFEAPIEYKAFNIKPMQFVTMIITIFLEILLLEAGS